MRSNKKKLLSVILGFMASISGTSAVMKLEKDTKSTNTEMMSKSKKRNQEGPGLGRNVAELVFAMFAGNEISSDFPVVKGFTYPLLRQMLSGYRVRRNVRGEFIRQDGGPNSLAYGYTVFNESDRNFYNINFSHFFNCYKNNVLKKDDFKEINNDNFNDLKSKKKVSIAKMGSMYDVRLVMEDENGVVLSGTSAVNIREFLKSDDFTVDDAANALSKAIGLVNIINSGETNEYKVKWINENIDVVCLFRHDNDNFHMLRIFVKERKNANGEMRKIFAEIKLQDEKTKEEIEKEDAEKLKNEMENQNKK